MNFQVFLFKLSMSLYYVLRLSLLFAPLTILLVFSRQGGWKYGFTFIQNSLGVGLFMAFAMGFMLGMYHVLSYELIGKGPLKNYLRSRQKVMVKTQRSLDEISDLLAKDDTNTVVTKAKALIKVRRKVIFAPADIINVEVVEGGVTIESEPYYRWWFIDFGRNFKHVKLLAKQIQ